MIKNIYKFKLFMIIILAIGFIINGVFITLYNVDKSSGVGAVSKEVSDLMSENNKLIENISVSDSLSLFLRDSESAGYAADVKILYFNQTGTVAEAR